MPYHYYNIDVRITIGNVQFNVVNSIEINNSVESLTDTAKITLPREFKNAKQNNAGLSLARKNILDYIKIGDPVTIESGYNGDLEVEFTGYVSSIHADIPLVIECEDEMWKLKRMARINKTYADTDMKTVIRDALPNYQIVTVGEVPLGKYIIENKTPYQILEKLKDFMIRSYFIGKTLHADLPVNIKEYKSHDFNMKRNVRAGSDLKYETKEGQQKLIKFVSKQKGTSKTITVEYGDKDGEVKEMQAPLNLNKTALQKLAKEWYDSKVYDGYSGSFDSWAIPRTRAGDSAKIKDPNYPDGHRDGTFFIEGVQITIDGSSGYKRKNTISRKL